MSYRVCSEACRCPTEPWDEMPAPVQHNSRALANQHQNHRSNENSKLAEENASLRLDKDRLLGVVRRHKEAGRADAVAAHRDRLRKRNMSANEVRIGYDSNGGAGHLVAWWDGFWSRESFTNHDSRQDKLVESAPIPAMCCVGTITRTWSQARPLDKPTARADCVLFAQFARNDETL